MVVAAATVSMTAAHARSSLVTRVFAIVAVLGLSSSSAAGLNAEIAALGTNLLTVQNGQTLTGGTAELPGVARAIEREKLQLNVYKPA